MPSSSIKETTTTPTHSKNRQWLKDRANGKSKPDASRPYLSICWVPPPVLWCPAILEENAFCRFWGTIGVQSKKKFRSNLLVVGFIANLIGFILTIVACFAISDDFDTLQRTSFGSGTISQADEQAKDISINIGLTAVAIDNPNGIGQRIIQFDELCDTTFTDDERAFRFLYVDQCNACADVASSMVSSVIVSVITFIPSFSTDFLRMYSHYDVNCQNGFATIFAVITLVLSLNTFLQFNLSCFDAFYEGSIWYDANGDVVLPESNRAVGELTFDWGIGTGLACLYAGTLLKLIDVVCHMLIATPSITRDVDEKAEYERRFNKADEDAGEHSKEDEEEDDYME